ncbi:MAG: hypothetical protein ABI177_09565 [Edaphobacter sp.]
MSETWRGSPVGEACHPDDSMLHIVVPEAPFRMLDLCQGVATQLPVIKPFMPFAS